MGTAHLLGVRDLCESSTLSRVHVIRLAVGCVFRSVYCGLARGVHAEVASSGGWLACEHRLESE